MQRTPAHAEWVGAALAAHGAALARYATSILRDEDLARDVVQDTFVRLCDETPERLDGHLTEWLFTVCRNRALDMQRKVHRLTPLEPEILATTPDQQPDPSAVTEHRDTLGVALGLLGTLPSRQQEVLRLKFQGGLGYEEIARVTGLSASNVGFLLHTAIRTLRQRLLRAL